MHHCKMWRGNILFPDTFLSFLCIGLFKFWRGEGKMISNKTVNGMSWLF